MTGPLAELGVDGLRFALLLVAHVLADFVLQSERMARNKHRLTTLTVHGVQVFAAHLVLLAPLLTWRAVAIVGGLAVAHIVVDAAKAALVRADRPRLAYFALDQAAHVVTLGISALLLVGDRGVLLVPGADRVAEWHSAMTVIAVVLAAIAFLAKGGTAIVRGVLAPFDGIPENVGGDDEYRIGRLIGVLERWLLLPLVVLGEWGALGLVVAAKSIARFEELGKRPFAEYYLVGTLASLIVAVAVGLAVAWLVV